MSSLTQSDFEDYMQEFNQHDSDFENMPDHDVFIDNNIYMFNKSMNYNEIIDLITWMIEDKKDIEYREQELIDFLDMLIKKIEEDLIRKDPLFGFKSILSEP